MPTDGAWIIPDIWNSYTPKMRRSQWPGLPTWVYHTPKRDGGNIWYSDDYWAITYSPEWLRRVRNEGARVYVNIRDGAQSHWGNNDRSELPWAIIGEWRDFRAGGQDEDEKRQRQVAQASMVSRLVLQGYSPESVVRAIERDDMSLIRHTGLHSVELLPPDGETRTTSSTGGEKGVKPERVDQVPPDSLLKIAEAFGYGAEKYSAYNWAKGYEWSKSYAALQRHLLAFWGGEDNDPESGLPHLAHAGTHIMFLLRFQDQFPQFDDRGPRSIGNDDEDPEE